MADDGVPVLAPPEPGPSGKDAAGKNTSQENADATVGDVTVGDATVGDATVGDPAGPEAAGEDAAGAQPADRRRSLSPSRAGDFMTCPLLYRFRVIDRLPEPPSPAAARGTLVHAVLEHLFDRPARGRTPEVARSLLDPEWDRQVIRGPELA